MKLQIASRLAIFAVLELAANSERQVSVVDIGQKYSVSNHHLAKVMHVLGRAGLVRSVRGAGGGYRFSGNVRRVTLLDIVELFEKLGSDRPNAYHARGTDEAHALDQILAEIDNIARATLGSITIATMLKLIERHAANPLQPASARP
jgi:Rrf2 family protein